MFLVSIPSIEKDNSNEKRLVKKHSFQDLSNKFPYHQKLESLVDEAHKVAELARAKRLDPTDDVEIYRAEDVASRTEGLVGPKNVAKRLREMEFVERLPKDKIVLKIAEEIAQGKFENGSPQILAEQAIRTALSVQTEGITAAPIEGISRVSIKSNPDGSNYLVIYFSGPIRSAGGTAQGVSILIADHVRKTLGLERYKSSDSEAQRMLEEVRAYNSKVHLQLPTSDKEILFTWKNLPVMISGDPTEKEEVSGYRNIESMETNRLRGGACLVLNDGVVGRAKKLLKRIRKLNLEGWEWIEEIAAGKYSTFKNSKKKNVNKGEYVVNPDFSFLSDAISGRPIFSGATQPGGFRVRYGHSRNTGIAAIGIHPATFGVLNDFLAPGTHVRTERPGKGSIVTPVDTIRPPIVKLSSGDVIEVTSYEKAVQIFPKIEKILFVGDLLIGFGEFVQNNYRLVPSGFTEEWWYQILRSKNNDYFKLNYKKSTFMKELLDHSPDEEEAIKISNELNIPLHPKYLVAWKYLSQEEVQKLHYYFNEENPPVNDEILSILDKSLTLYKITNNRIFVEYQLTFLAQLRPDTKIQNIEFKDGLDLIQQHSELIVLDVMGTTMGARMGRPEKAKSRRIRPARHGLFPLSQARGIRNELRKAELLDEVIIALSHRRCEKCKLDQYQRVCIQCGEETRLVGRCTNRLCGMEMDEEPCDNCGSSVSFRKTYKVKIHELISEIQTKIGEIPKSVKLIDKLNNPNFVPEMLEKGILRGKYDLHVFRDGTIRYDATDAPLTHFTPAEIGTSVKKLNDLGYIKDVEGNLLEKENQIVALFPQDIIVNKSFQDHALKVSNFIDELLSNVYDLPPYYKFQTGKDVIGHLVIGLAPHTSAGVIGRIIGFTRASVCWAHPYWHSAKRRNCLAYNEELILVDMDCGEIVKTPIGSIVEYNEARTNVSRIVDEFGSKTIKNSLTNYRVISVDEESGNVIFQRIKHWVKGSDYNWVIVTTQGGKVIKMTQGHKQLLSIGNKTSYVSARDLKVGDKILSTNLNSSKSSLKDLVTEELKIMKIEFQSVLDYSYCLEVEEEVKGKSPYHNILLSNGLFTGQCDGDEDGIVLLLDGFLNFSKQYLPTTRGSKMDAPLVLVSKLNPQEVDDEAFNLDATYEYPMELYIDSETGRAPTAISNKIPRVENFLGTFKQFLSIPYTHSTSQIDIGPLVTKYKTIPSMQDKLLAQMELATLISSVDERFVASQVLKKHFVPDLMGNLRSFAGQGVYCPICKKKYRRVPLSGFCTNQKCTDKTKLRLNIHAASVSKYLSISQMLIEKYNLSQYMIDRIDRIRLGIEGLFPEEEDKQLDLSEFF